MNAAALRQQLALADFGTTEEGEPIETTLLDLVAAVADSARNEREVIATIKYLLASGRVRLVGNFQGPDVRRT